MLKRTRLTLTLTALSLLGPACSTTAYRLADPEPSYDATKGYVRVLDPPILTVEDQAGGVGTVDATGLYLIHGRHLRALLAAASRPH